LVLYLILSSLSQGLPGFTLTVPQSVSVQEGLCVLIPCTFTYSASSNTYSSWPQLYRYWYKDQASVVWNPPVASSESSREVSQETRGRFQLAKNPAHGDCSLQISDARRTDAGKYFFRFKKGTLMYNYLSNSYGTDAKLAISVPDGLPGTLLAGEPVTVTCTAPGRCSGPPPRVTWTGPFRNTAQDVSTQLANGSWAYSSALSFTPGPGDHGKELVCTISYRPPWGPSTRRTVQLHVPPLLGSPLLGFGPALQPLPQLSPGDVVSLETQEDDSLSLSCDAGSRPEATLSWARMNRSLSPGQEGTRRLELPNLRIGDAGEYRCWAKNSYGSASRALRVHVQSKALGGAVLQGSGQGFNPSTLVANGSQLSAREGDSLRFLCSVASSPPAALGWVRGGRAIKGTRPAGENQLQLELPNVTDEDGGLYGCWAQNKQSSAQGTFQLQVEYLGQPMQSTQQGGCKSLPGVSALLLTQDHKTPAAHWTKGIQDGAAAAQAPLGPGKPDELHYASINFSKLQCKGVEPPEAPDKEYSEVRLK
uniref:Ig-like domain-containing protein n=1 Tax=Chelonoidis abingdonii TaxID=106734 RepID=A0A8C0FZJ1_CHEAB